MALRRTPTSRPAIRLRQVTKRFPGAGADAVGRGGGLDLDVAKGSIVALLGPSGCGKTTTLRMINRMIEPTSGRIEIEGRDVTQAPVAELRRGIGYVIQQVGLFPHHTVARNIAAVPNALRWDKDRTTARIQELADLVGLEPSMLTRYPDELSGGQQQRVGVARALAADPPVLLMDEPFGAVDPVVRSRLQDELLGLQSRVHKTIVLVTHDLDEAIKLADRIALLNVGGVLEQYASPDDLLRAPANEFVERFVGGDRSIRRLTLATVADLPFDIPARGPVVDVATATADDARAAMATHRSDVVRPHRRRCLPRLGPGHRARRRRPPPRRPAPLRARGPGGGHQHPAHGDGDHHDVGHVGGRRRRRGQVRRRGHPRADPGRPGGRGH